MLAQDAPSQYVGDIYIDDSLVIAWIARILADSGSWRRGYCRQQRAFDIPELLEPLGLSEPAILEQNTPPQALRLKAAEAIGDIWPRDQVYKNLSRLAEYLGISEAEIRLLTFAFHL